MGWFRTQVLSLVHVVFVRMSWVTCTTVSGSASVVADSVAAGEVPLSFVAVTWRKYVVAGVRSEKVTLVVARPLSVRSDSPAVVRVAVYVVAPVEAVHVASMVCPDTVRDRPVG
jgi:hypothetical protein